MADFSLNPITVPDDKVADFIEALRWHFDNQAATPAQLKALVTDKVRADLVGIYKAWRKYQLTINPPSDEIDIT